MLHLSLSHVLEFSAKILSRPTSSSIGWMAERSGVAERVCELTEQLLGSLVNKDPASLNIQQPWSVAIATSSKQ